MASKPGVLARRDGVLALVRQHSRLSAGELAHIERTRAGAAVGRTAAHSPVIDQLWPDLYALERQGLVRRVQLGYQTVGWEATEPPVDVDALEAAIRRT